MKLQLNKEKLRLECIYRLLLVKLREKKDLQKRIIKFQISPLACPWDAVGTVVQNDCWRGDSAPFKLIWIF
jgi:hypothetical protein